MVFPPWTREGPRSCAFEGIRASPATHAYRNKSEFTVGWDAEGAPTVGFRIGTYKVGGCFGGVGVGGTRSVPGPLHPTFTSHPTPAIPQEGSVLVHEVGGCALLDDTAKGVAAALQEYVRAPGAPPPYDTINHGGVWRTATVRTSQRTGQCLAIIVAAPGGVPADSGRTWAEEQARLVRWLTAPVKPADPLNAEATGEAEGQGSKAWTGITGLYIWVRAGGRGNLVTRGLFRCGTPILPRTLHTTPHKSQPHTHSPTTGGATRCRASTRWCTRGARRTWRSSYWGSPSASPRTRSSRFVLACL